MAVLPDHQDWDGECVHRELYDAVTTHTKALSMEGSPDVCRECSAAVQEWVEWPCPRMKVAVLPDHGREPGNVVSGNGKSVRCPACGKVPKGRAGQAAELLALLFMSPGGFA